jgi:hypothetical protein
MHAQPQDEIASIIEKKPDGEIEKIVMDFHLLFGMESDDFMGRYWSEEVRDDMKSWLRSALSQYGKAREDETAKAFGGQPAQPEGDDREDIILQFRKRYGSIDATIESFLLDALFQYGKAQFEAGKKAGMLESFQKGFEAGEEIGFEAGEKKADELIKAIHLYNTDAGYTLKQAQIITRKQVMDDMKAGRCPMRCTEWNYAGSCEHLNHA